MTQSGYEKLKTELERLEREERPVIAKILKEAIAQGDLSENFAYHDGKRRQGEMEDRISALKNELKHAQVEEKKGGDTVGISSTVTVTTEDGSQREYTITGKEEADPASGKISYDSPLGSAFMDRAVGDTVTANTPMGPKTYTIKKIA
ncbi:MAG: transcription elongation factor GreA [Candidatus Spechtbacterales bacterium]